jgi:cyanate permease
VLVAPGAFAVFLPLYGWVTVLCGLWIGQAVALAALERAVGVLPPQAAWLAGLGAGGGALATAMGPFLVGQSRHSWAEVVVLDTVALAAVVLAVRLGTA